MNTMLGWFGSLLVLVLQLKNACPLRTYFPTGRSGVFDEMSLSVKYFTCVPTQPPRRVLNEMSVLYSIQIDIEQ